MCRSEKQLIMCGPEEKKISFPLKMMMEQSAGINFDAGNTLIELQGNGAMKINHIECILM